jgi:hypothetical protein
MNAIGGLLKPFSRRVLGCVADDRVDHRVVHRRTDRILAAAVLLAMS